VLAKVGGFSNALIEDFELSFRIYRKGGRIAFAPLSIVYDEKPTNMRFMIRQRSRWVKGHFDLLKVKIPESHDIVGIIYWLNPILMLGGLSAIGITSFAALYFLFFGVIPYQFSFVPVGVWIGATLASMTVQMVVLAKELGIKGLRYAGYAAYLAVFSHYWYVTLIKSFFVKSWSNNKTSHGFMSAKDIDTIIAEVGKMETKA
jgi:cellulose synthase/poly-beta-1,6-N-acetylglucosamine synthase-like glycosyltransferase